MESAGSHTGKGGPDDRDAEAVFSGGQGEGGAGGDPAEDLELMRLNDGRFLETPWYGTDG